MADINELLRKIAEQKAGTPAADPYMQDNELDTMLDASEAPAQQKVAIAEEGELPTSPDPVDVIQTEQINEEAKSPYQKTAQELQQDEASDLPEPTALESLKAKIAEYQNVADAKKAPSSDDNVMNWLTGIGQAANVLNKASGKKTQDIKYWGDTVKAREAAEKKAKLDKIKNVQDMYQKYIGAEDKQKAASDLKEYRDAQLEDTDLARKSADAYKKAQLEDTDLARKQRYKMHREKLSEAKLKRELDKLNTSKKLTPEEKEYAKLQAKDKFVMRKENRKVREESGKAVEDIDDQISAIKRAQRLLTKATKNSNIDTGPVDQYLAMATDEGQELRQAMNDISLTRMVKMFAGMSKAIDSESDRKFFEAAQASMGKFPESNKKILKSVIERLKTIRARAVKQKNSISLEGDRKEEQEKEEKENADSRNDSYPKQVRKDGQVATVSNAEEEKEARNEGWK